LNSFEQNCLDCKELSAFAGFMRAWSAETDVWWSSVMALSWLGYCYHFVRMWHFGGKESSGGVPGSPRSDFDGVGW
jgi:hypothetical protein